MKRSSVFLIAFLLTWQPASRAFAQPKPTMEQILAKWKERQEKVVSARFVCEEEMTRPKGATSKLLVGEVNLKPGDVFPPQDHTYVTPLYLSFDGEKMRIDYRQLDWRETIKEYHHVYTFDGVSGKIIHDEKDSHPQGSIRSENHNRHVANFHVRAILMAYRALHPRISPKGGSEYELTGRAAVVGGRKCFEVWASGRGGMLTKLWVDPVRGYLPARIVLTADSTDLATLDVEYGEQADVGWVPLSWSLVMRQPKGWISETARTKVTRHEINVDIPQKEFDPEFPVGTFVVNTKSGETFIQKEDGEKRTVAPSERSRPYEELLNTPGPSKFSRLLTWPIVTIAIVLAITGAVIVVWWRRSKKVSSV
jgi:hypothetical protein